MQEKEGRRKDGWRKLLKLGMKERRDSGLTGFRTAGGIPERRDTGKEGCGKRGKQDRRFQDRRDAVQKGYRKGGMQDRRHARKQGCRNV